MLLLIAKHELDINETTQGGDFLSPIPLPDIPSANYGSKISPSIVLIIVILAAIFFVSGLLHLLVRILFRSTARGPEESQNVTALQGQLQELFQLHDAGVDQSFIDMLPIFLYKTIIGLNDPFDCAVCLSEFEPEDKLRLLPKCSHAFHIECIDTWLLSHSTCPLCRRSLFHEFSPACCFSPVVLVVESGSETSREILGEELGLNSHVGFSGEECLGSPKSDLSIKPGQLVPKGKSSLALMGFADEELVPVKLGKFRNADVEGGEGCSNGSGNREQSQRRCFSMGSYEYMLDDSCMLQVAITPVKEKPNSHESGRRVAASDCDCHSKREGFKIVDGSNVTIGSGKKSTTATCLQKESFSFSKIWLRERVGKEEVDGESRRRAFSFRFPLPGVLSEEKKAREEF
ncbi:hypothetical protein HPP92_017445 [Vanilla planifolia]|uniref:RING-type E3 ubiquitin transferase n=1 Tax=Vanilla planifolia TaxID=51239 RepID=A0A835QHS1_VANPL|nr:hypothetical protein HPP92_017445 [Vanilla planifolia]